jgi:hypothetical protein
MLLHDIRSQRAPSPLPPNYLADAGELTLRAVMPRWCHTGHIPVEVPTPNIGEYGERRPPVTSPIATGHDRLIGTPASISDRLEAQTLAIEVLPHCSALDTTMV